MDIKAQQGLSDSQIVELANLCADALKKAFDVKPDLSQAEAQKVMDDMASMYSLAVSMQFPSKNLVN